jgi:thiamine pyrophosphokinase
VSQPTALILGDGPPPSKELLRQLVEENKLLLCADGGANHAVACGLTPDYVVGDLDSLEPEVKQHLAPDRLVRIDADNTGTDMQKVLNHALELNVKTAVLTAVTGGRADHTLWNLGLLKTYADRLDLRIVDDYHEIRLISASIRFSARVGLKLSLAPLRATVEGITTTGLKFPLSSDSLSPGVRDGISNEVIATPVEIWVGKGDLLLCIQREEGDAEIDLGG